jgi:parvulin-like peptidyl-prolyl isomerase
MKGRTTTVVFDRSATCCAGPRRLPAAAPWRCAAGWFGILRRGPGVLSLRASLLTLAVAFAAGPADRAKAADAAREAGVDAADGSSEPRKLPPAPAAKDIAATVNGEPILRAEVENGVRRVLGGRQVAENNQAPLQAEVLSQLIDRQLVSQFVSRSGIVITDVQLALAEKQMRLQLESQKVSWDTFLADQKQTEAEFRSRLAWQLLWDRYLQRALNDMAYETFFEAHRQDFDGTELRVSHVLLRPAKSNDPEGAQKLIAEAASLRERIESGQLAFDEAARRYSAGPSREQGGDLGFIPRQGPMVEAFAQAAFRLKPGEISQPVVTPFGVHLIKVTEVKPGTKKWSDVREQLKGPISQVIFATVAQQARAKAEIDYSPGVPHFKPGTRDLE